MPEARKLTITGWLGYMPQELLDAFSAEMGVVVEYIGYDTTEAAIAALEQGAGYDLMIVSYQFIPDLISSGAIVPINYANIPNTRNLSANFRDLAFDPGNRYSVVYQWGTTGLLIRTDLLDRPIMRWSDLWEPALDGKILLWPIPRDAVNVLLKSLGFSINTTNPAHLATALERAPDFARRVGWVGEGVETVTPYLVSGEYVVGLGWAYDALDAQRQSDQIAYITPGEGTILWVDSFVIPAVSMQQALAEQFIDFFLRPDISALVTNELATATANEASWPLVKPEFRDSEIIFPSLTTLQRAELELPLDPETQAKYDEIWNAFFVAKP
ncbi:spermidine/putrescine ABC transporter substrate-binding protein [uncultured Chloroflexus sp.]|uniref:polyamine ABC transporter substrate-binding protein n=1 Tax=uncultured Chloroflexus sp. TaxID=214040 RepID=UPI00261B97E3|nr:spermidine/putrescine ABC transporter substrate-binding protein [uncultured Chloroflexus sp.]